MGNVRVSLRVTGLVQGVSFRAGARAAAASLGLVGWVRNEADGSVAAVAEGPKTSVEEFVAWCHRGSAGAVVDAVEANWGPAGGQFADFSVRR